MRLILEFGAESQFQLLHDALRAFPAELQAKAEIFYWPVEKRELDLFAGAVTRKGVRRRQPSPRFKRQSY
jgi:hypothetical protein